jgi:hypothetical protein
LRTGGGLVRLVRQSPALRSWFATTEAPIGGTIADQSGLIQALTAGFLIALGPDEPGIGKRRAAGWCGS